MTAVDEFAGTWTYRSFINDPDPTTAPDCVMLAAADLVLEVEGRVKEVSATSAGLDLDGGHKISGKQTFHMGPTSIYLTVSDETENDKPPTIRFRSTGVEGTPTAGWIYDFIGHLDPSWPKGDKQRPAIAGTAIRTVQHLSLGGTEVRPAGFTFSFIAASRDHPASS